ncbi:MAG: phosphate acyltransferase PlsX [Proteobacteria bacterium]|nr:phosphate acyltransferase PlsX [Pseudomonadota bacterium]MDA1059281.1 phosphate acyltransferase PlsX [Pseudomonadota bacterium]
MTQPITIALDAMGGDKAPGIVLKGADIARKRHPDVKFLLFGDERRVGPILKRFPKLAGRCEIRHAPQVITAEDKPSQALRRGKESSMRLAINAVRDGECGGVVSAGNTGALLAMSKFVLKTVAGIDRPAMAGVVPTTRGESVILDLGANIECTADNLVQFAIMGAEFARSVLGVRQPMVGLLNVGTEELKGHEDLKLAAQILRESTSLPLAFEGFVEGDDIGQGTVDVVVTDGFTGNIALKTAEGTAKFYSEMLRTAFRRSILSRVGYVLARPALRAIRKRVDPRTYNGALFVGLNGVVVKSHGGTDAIGFANAIGVAADLIRGRFNEQIVRDLQTISSQGSPGTEAAVS